MLENLVKAKRGNFGPGHCKIDNILSGLEQADADILKKVLEDGQGYSTHGIFRGLRESGVDIGYGTIDRHRKNLCACRENNA